MLLHYVSERMAGSIRGSALSGAEVVAFVTFVWMMVQRGEYVGELTASFSLACLGLVWGGSLTICSAERCSSWDGRTCFDSPHARWTNLPRSTSWGCHLDRGHVPKSCIARKWKEATIGICSHVCVELYKYRAQRPRHILTQYLQVIHKCTKCAETLDSTEKRETTNPPQAVPKLNSS